MLKMPLQVPRWQTTCPYVPDGKLPIYVLCVLALICDGQSDQHHRSFNPPQERLFSVFIQAQENGMRQVFKLTELVIAVDLFVNLKWLELTYTDIPLV